MLNFLRAYAVSHVADARMAPYETDGPSPIYLLYQRTPGVQVAMLTVQLHAPEDGGDSTAATLSISVGASTASMEDAAILTQSGSFGGGEEVFLPSRKMRLRDELVAFIDVSDFDPETVTLVRVSYFPEVTTEVNGIARVSLSEVPLATVDPTGSPSTEPGVNEAEADVRNRIHQGTTDGKTGLLRMFSELEVARTKVRQHMQFTVPLQLALTRNSTTLGPLDWNGGVGTAWDARLRGRARRRYGEGTANKCRLWVLYFYPPTYSDLSGSYLRVTATTDLPALGGASTVVADLPLQNTESTGWLLDSVPIEVPTDGNDQRFEVQLSAVTTNEDGLGASTSSTVLVAAFALIEDET